jgi:glutamyl-Q tRNA(Asp) synthetase
MWQSRRLPDYARALEQLRRGGLLFRCDCTRAMLGPDGACRGRCQPRQGQVGDPSALRVRVPGDCRIEFDDRLQGRQSHQLGQEWPDFVVRRKDGLDAYQLAVVVDDAAQGISHVVRGSDLLDSTPRQLFLQRLLGFPGLDYCHLPVITDRGEPRPPSGRRPGARQPAQCPPLPPPGRTTAVSAKLRADPDLRCAALGAGAYSAGTGHTRRRAGMSFTPLYRFSSIGCHRDTD